MDLMYFSASMMLNALCVTAARKWHKSQSATEVRSGPTLYYVLVTRHNKGVIVWVFLQLTQFWAASGSLPQLKSLDTTWQTELKWTCLKTEVWWRWRKVFNSHFFSCLSSIQYYLEPPARLREALEQKGLKPESFFTLDHGESRLVASQQGDVFDWSSLECFVADEDLCL